MLVSIWMGTNMADRNQQKQSSVIAFGYKCEFILRGTHKHESNIYPKM